MDCWCDYDPPEFFSKRISTARKQHRCFECNRSIAEGERYECAAGKWEGYFDAFKTCERCLALRDYVQGNVPCFCWAYGNMLEDAYETADDARMRAGDEAPGFWFGFLRRQHAVYRQPRAA